MRRSPWGLAGSAGATPPCDHGAQCGPRAVCLRVCVHEATSRVELSQLPGDVPERFQPNGPLGDPEDGCLLRCRQEVWALGNRPQRTRTTFWEAVSMTADPRTGFMELGQGTQSSVGRGCWVPWRGLCRALRWGSGVTSELSLQVEGASPILGLDLGPFPRVAPVCRANSVPFLRKGGFVPVLRVSLVSNSS